MKIILHTALCAFLFFACIEGQKPNQEIVQGPEKTKPKIANDALTLKLYADYIDNPTDQAHHDQNKIIDYALENNLDVQKTASGLYYTVTKNGSGPRLQFGQPVSVEYQGYFLDGKVFDSSYKRGVPLDFKVGQMIAGWNEALKLFNKGTKATLLVPSRLAYGPTGYGPVPSNTVIGFDIVILE